MTYEICEAKICHPENIELARKGQATELELLDAGDLLKVLGDPTRIRLLSALMTTELCVCDLAELLGMSQSSISHQLRILRQSRLVRYRRDGKNAFYSLNDEHVRAIVEMALRHVREMYQPAHEQDDQQGSEAE